MLRKVWKKLPVWRTGVASGLVLTILLSGLEALLSLYIQPGSLKVLCTYLLGQPYLLFLNLLPFTLLNLAAFFLFLNPFFASALVGGLTGLLSLVNRTMIEKRDEPLSPKDFALLREAGDAARSYDMSFHVFSLLAILAFVLVMVALGLVVGREPPFEKWWQNLCLCALGAAASCGILVGCVMGVYSSKDLYNSFPVNNRYYITGVYNQLGFPYCFCYNFNTYLVDKPEGFTPQAARACIAETEPVPGDHRDVNVIVVMNEAFSDVTDNENFLWGPGEDPLQHYKALSKEKNAIAGHIVVPNYGAGTANAEFDVLTGMQTNMISESGASAFRVLHRDTDSLFRVFRDDGYFTEFIHPGQDWFYNRQNVYRYFGAEELLFSERFEDAERKGTWVTDAAVLEVMKEEFEEAVQKDRPYFNYTVTIQNHMSYTAKKYEDHPIPPVKLKKEVSDTAQTMLSVYTEGVRDSDTMLGGLTEYYSQRSEPVLLVFFGDHLPQLGDGYLCYEELGVHLGENGSPEDVLFTYETPYLIWANEPAAKLLDFDAARKALELPEDNTVNANYLGAIVLELTGRGGEDPFFGYLNELRRELPILHNGAGRLASGEYFSEPPESVAGSIRKMRFWEYYRLKYE